MRETDNLLNWRAQLRFALGEYFSESDLKGIAFDLNLDLETISGSNKSEKIIGIIDFFEKLDRINELIDACKRQRPNVNWDEIASAAENRGGRRVQTYATPMTNRSASEPRIPQIQRIYVLWILSIFTIIIVVAFFNDWISFNDSTNPVSEDQVDVTPLLEFPNESKVYGFDNPEHNNFYDTEAWDIYRKEDRDGTNVDQWIAESADDPRKCNAIQTNGELIIKQGLSDGYLTCILTAKHNDRPLVSSLLNRRFEAEVKIDDNFSDGQLTSTHIGIKLVSYPWPNSGYYWRALCGLFVEGREVYTMFDADYSRAGGINDTEAVFVDRDFPLEFGTYYKLALELDPLTEEFRCYVDERLVKQIVPANIANLVPELATPMPSSSQELVNAPLLFQISSWRGQEVIGTTSVKYVSIKPIE